MNTWIIPCNPNMFDIVEHFSNNTKMMWKATSSTEEGDLAFIYVGRPFSSIMFKCEIIRSRITYSEILKSEYDILKHETKMRKNYVEMQLIEKYPSTWFPFKELVRHELLSVQSQMRMPNELIKYMSLKLKKKEDR